jgi:hypothetical protein
MLCFRKYRQGQRIWKGQGFKMSGLREFFSATSGRFWISHSSILRAELQVLGGDNTGFWPLPGKCCWLMTRHKDAKTQKINSWDKLNLCLTRKEKGTHKNALYSNILTFLKWVSTSSVIWFTFIYWLKKNPQYYLHINLPGAYVMDSVVITKNRTSLFCSNR